MPGQLVSVLLVALAVAVLAVVVFAVRQALARPKQAYDWRTLPPGDESDALAVADDEDYGPLWRYGVPMGYGRVYDAGHDRANAPS